MNDMNEKKKYYCSPWKKKTHKQEAERMRDFWNIKINQFHAERLKAEQEQNQKQDQNKEKKLTSV